MHSKGLASSRGFRAGWCYASDVELSRAAISACLTEFGIELPDYQLAQVLMYTELLLRWNRAINLTAVQGFEDIIRRHFVESIYLTRFVRLAGQLLDVGSGAGFPGLALKIAVPELSVVLLEPVAKKRAFLKEVVRECGLGEVEVCGTRVEDFCVSHEHQFNSATLRAVGHYDTVLPSTARCLANFGSVYLWLTRAEASKLTAQEVAFGQLFAWLKPIAIPLSRDREIWCGTAKRAGVG